MSERISDERIAEIQKILDAHDAAHKTHGIGCGCNPYQDVIYGLPEFDPEDARNKDVPEQLDIYYLSDGTEIDGDRDGWRISRHA